LGGGGLGMELPRQRDGGHVIMTYRERFDPNLPEFAPGTPSYSYFILRHLKAMPYIVDKLVLDIPCGLGVGTKLIAEGAHKVLGIDRDKESLERARENADPEILRFEDGYMEDLRDIVVDDLVDVVTCFEGYEHLTREGQPRFLAEAHRVLVPGGLLIMTCPVGTGKPSSNPFHLHEPTVDELVEETAKLFSIERLEAITDHGAVIMVARKEKKS